MNKIGQILQLILQKSAHRARCAQCGPACSIKTQVKVNETLLNRSAPAREILANLGPDDSATLQAIRTEHQFLSCAGKFVPSRLSDDACLQLLCLSRPQRARYYRHLARKEGRRLARDTREARPEKELLAELPNRHVSKYVAKHVRLLETHRAFQAIVLRAQEVVVDCSYEDDMSLEDMRALARQIQFCYELNRGLDECFQLVLANLSGASATRALLARQLLQPQDGRRPRRLDELAMRVECGHYSALFPGRRLVYLSPQSGHYFRDGEYDHDAVYILGGLVDKGHAVPASLARARRENLEHRALPLDRCVKWRSGSKSLTLDQVLRALSIARSTNGDWQAAIERSVPARAFVATR